MQLNLFDFRESYSYKFQDYIFLDGNLDTYNMLMSKNLWSCFVLYGESGSGKTHLAHIWQRFMDAIFIMQRCGSISSTVNLIDKNKTFIIEDIDEIQDEIWILHCYNYIKENNKKLLMTSSIMPSLLNFKLKDLKSRILSTMNANLVSPNEELLKIALIKHFSDRQWHVDLKVISYILKKIDRSFKDIRNVVRLIEQELGNSEGGITIPFIRSIMEKNALSI